MRPPRRPPAPASPPSRLLFASESLRAGCFAIAPEAPGFADAGQMLRAEIVFPRTNVWIEHADAPPFATDPTLVTLYNAHEPYRRRALDAAGDRCDWFAPAPELLLEIVACVDPAVRERPERPFRWRHAPVDARSVLTERLLARHLRSADGCDPLEVEETMLELLHRIVRAARRRDGAPAAGPARASRPIADDVKAYVLPRASERLTLDPIARALGCSPFQLCRQFKSESGQTVHAWLVEVRLRQSLERVADSRGDLAAIAVDAGFSSHSHFTTAFRRAFGLTPSAYRRRMAASAAARLAPR